MSEPARTDPCSVAPFTQRLAEVLAKVASDAETARRIARRAGIRVEYLHDFKTATGFWERVLEHVENGGASAGALLALTEQMLRELPHNAELGALAEELRGASMVPEPSTNASRGTSGSRGVLWGESGARSWTRAVIVGALLFAGGLVSLAYVQRSSEAPSVVRSEDAASMIPENEDDEEVTPRTDLPAEPAAAAKPSDPSLEPPSDCWRDSDCGAGWSCERRGKSSGALLGTITKTIDRGSHSQIVGRDCPSGKKRVGRPRAKISGRGTTECRVEWRAADVRSCEVDGLVLGPAFEEVRCDVYATLQPERGVPGRCKPLAAGGTTE